MKNKIAIIIPVYKAHDTIQVTLCSIGMQRVIEYKIYLIIDGEPIGSYDYLKSKFDIEIMYLPQNGGAGVARQHGLDNTQEEFISFIDADDTYISSLALYYQFLPFKDNVGMVATTFAEENKNHTIRLKEKDMIWMHGKMYRRAFIDKYDIRFNKTRANEDVGFNTQCQCYANEDEYIGLSTQITYLWQWRDNSIVRSNNQAYAIKESIKNYVINKVYAIQRVLDKIEMNEHIKYLILTGGITLFDKHQLAKKQSPKQSHYIKKWAKVYHNKLYTLLDTAYITKMEKELLAAQYKNYMKWKKGLIK
jgi:glycosyltransferase involved in cell wall biosynthesis